MGEPSKDSSTQDADRSAEAAFLLELQEALNALEPRELCYGRLISGDGKCCALGSVVLARGLAKPTDSVAWHMVSGKTLPCALGITSKLAQRVAEANDGNRHEDPDARWSRMRLWVQNEIIALERE